MRPSEDVRVWLALVAALLPAAPAPAPRSGPSLAAIAVIAHPDLPLGDLSLGELRRVFLGNRQFWSDDLPVTLLVPGPGTPERALLLDKVYEKTETQYRHYWIAKVFRAEVASAPKVVSTPRMAAELVRTIEGAVTIVDPARIPPGVKVLKVNGKGWDNGAYPLR